MPLIPQIYAAMEGVTINSKGTATSATLDMGRCTIRGLHYILSTATTGAYVSATARFLMSADPDATFLAPVDSAGAAANTLFVAINSNNRYIVYPAGNLPYAPFVQLQVLSSTDNALTISKLYVIGEEIG